MERGGQTISLAVASKSPSGLNCNVRRAEEWAGMMLTLPVDISTSWTCPVVRPGKAICREDSEQMPQGLFAVS